MKRRTAAGGFSLISAIFLLVVLSGLAVFLATMSGVQHATVQLSVPVIAAIGGVLLLSEDVTLRLVVASAATLGGVALVLTQRNRSR